MIPIQGSLLFIRVEVVKSQSIPFVCVCVSVCVCADSDGCWQKEAFSNRQRKQSALLWLVVGVILPLIGCEFSCCLKKHCQE